VLLISSSIISSITLVFLIPLSIVMASSSCINPQSKANYQTIVFAIGISLVNIFIVRVPKRMVLKKKRIAKDYFEFLLYLLFHDYSGLVYNYN
jgi:hypothetical protein